MNLRVTVPGGRVLNLNLHFPYEGSPIGYRVLLANGKTGIVVGLSEKAELSMSADFPDDKPVVLQTHLETLKDLANIYGLNPWSMVFSFLPEELIWKEETYIVVAERSKDMLDSKSREVVEYVRKRRGVKEESLKDKFGWRLVELLVEKGFLKKERRWDAPKVSVKIFTLNMPFESAYEELKKLKKREGKLSILSFLKDRGFATEEEMKEMGFKAGDLNYLIKKSIVAVKEGVDIYTDSYAGVPLEYISPKKIQKGTVLFGSYGLLLERLKSILYDTFKMGSSALVVCSSLSTLFSLERVLKSLFGDHLLVISSKESSKKVIKNWFKAQEGGKIVLGSRLSLLTPIRDLGLIVLFDDAGTKLPNGVDVRNFLYVLSKYTGAKFLMAIPSLDVSTYYLIRRKKMDYECSWKRLDVLVLERKEREVISGECIKILENFLDRRVLFLVNKKGYGYAYCIKCQSLCICPVCGSFLTIYKERERLLCTNCGFKGEPACLECGSKVESSSFGVEKVMEEVENLFGIREGFSFSTYPDLGGSYHLVVVLSADNLLSVPFFNAEEGFYKYLWRARAVAEDTLVVQTLFPKHPLLEELKEGDWEAYFQRELLRREEEGLPPFSKMLLVRFSQDRRKELERIASEYKVELRCRKTGRLTEALFKTDKKLIGKLIKRVRNLKPVYFELL